MAIDCTWLEVQVTEIGDQVRKAQQEEIEVLTNEKDAKDKLAALQNDRETAAQMIATLGPMIKAYEAAIEAMEHSSESRVDEYQRGVEVLTKDKHRLEAELRRVCDLAGRSRITNQIGMVALAIKEHEQGIREIRHAAEQTTAATRHEIQRASDEVQAQAQQLQQLDADLPWAEQKARATADQARQAHERIGHLLAESRAKEHELRECYARQLAAAPAGSFLRR